MSNSFKEFPTHFSRRGEAPHVPPGYGPVYKPNSATESEYFLITEKTKDLSCGFHTNWYVIHVYSVPISLERL